MLVRLEALPRKSGMEPVRELEPKFRYVREVRNPSEEGRLPLKLLELPDKYCRLDIKPIVVGNVLLSSLFCTFKYVSEERVPSEEGSEPERD